MIVAREKVQSSNLPALPAEKRRSRRRPVKRSLIWKERLALTGLVILFFCSSLLIAYYYAQVQATGYRLSKAETQLADLRKESDDLYTRINQLSSLENIETLAINRLGMVKPQNDQIIVVQRMAPVEQAAGTVEASKEPEDGAGGNLAGGKHEQNWVIRAFTKMVGRLEASKKAG